MAINYPINPEIGDTFESGGTTWQWDGTAWNVVPSGTGDNKFTTIQADTGSTTADGTADVLTLAGGTDIATSITGDTVTFNFTGEAGGGAGDVFKNVVSDDGTAVASGNNDTLSILGGTNISTAIATDTKNVAINMDAFDIGFLSNVSNAAASTGQVLKWDGAQWAPGSDVASGGGGDTTSVIAPFAFANVGGVNGSGTNITFGSWNAGTGILTFTFSVEQANANYIVVTDGEFTDDGALVQISNKATTGFDATFYNGSGGVTTPSTVNRFTVMVYGSTPTIDVSVGANADTLDGFEGTYYLDYNNFVNTPSVVTLTDFSVGNELPAAGDGAISYDNTTGVFRYTPPTAAGIGALTSISLDGVSDVSITSVADNNLLAYDSSTSEWINQTPTEAGFASVATSGLYSDLSGTPIIPADLSDLTDTTGLIPTDLTDLGIVDGADGQVLTTDGAGNFTFTTVTSGGVTQNLFATISADSGSTTANSATDTLTVAGGSSISTAISGDTLTINYNGAAGVQNFDDLQDAQSANLATIDEFVVRSGMHFEVDNIGATAYTFEPLYSGSNPTITVISGMQISFKLNVGGHPFEIQDNTLTALTQNIIHVAEDGTVTSGSSANGQHDSGTLIWSIPENTSGTYAYECTLHPAMVGAINIKRLSTL